MRRSRVLLPEPLGPMIVTTSPRFTEKSRPRSTWRWPYAFQASAQTTNGKPSLAAFRVAWTPASSTMSTGAAAAAPSAPARDASAGSGIARVVSIGPSARRDRGPSRKPKNRPSADSDGRRRSNSRLNRRSKRNCAPAITVVIVRYMRPAAVKTAKNWKFCATICWLRRVSSFTAITEAQEGDDKTQHEAARHRGGSDLDRQPGAFQQEGEREVTKEIAQPIYCLRISTGMTRAGSIPFFFSSAFCVPFAWRASRASLTTLTSSSLPFLTATPILIPVLNANARSSVSRFCRTTSSTRTRSYIDRSVRSFRMARVVAGAFGYVVISIGGFPAATHFSL